MKKVININFQGRVIPIEETAYEMLKVYVDSLRTYFANEEGRDEIINDIEGRIAELFSEQLKKGSTCITDNDLNVIIANMGRPADFAAQDADTSIPGSQNQEYYQQSQSAYAGGAHPRGRLVRNADDKILGGVCSGLANYLRIDPVIVRIIFVILFGALFWVYILLWIIVPSQSISSNITKRLFRNPDGKVIAGVCGGLAAYFNIDTWIPRLVFVLPFIIALVSGSFNALWWDWDFGFVPRVVSGSLGWTLFLTYVILWIAVPLANTAAEKLEMKGERINLNSIRDTVKEDLESFRVKAERFGNEVKTSAQQFGEKAREFGQSAGTQAKSFAAEAAPIARRTGSGLGHVIGVLFKAFFLFIAAIIAITLFSVFIGLLFGGFAVFPLKDFILDGFTQNLLAWGALFLFLGVPIVALVTWLIRRIVGVRSKNHYLGYVFGSLWFVGLVCAITLGGLIVRNFKTRSAVEDNISITQPAAGRLIVESTTGNDRYYSGSWFELDEDEDWPFYGVTNDSMMLNNVRVNIVQSKDSSYHIYRVKIGRGNTREKAAGVAEKIDFEISQQDSVLLLPRGFAISDQEKFRNQQVLVVIEVPVGKRILLSDNLDTYNWYSVNFNRRKGWNIDSDDNWDNSFNWKTNVDYVMTSSGLRPLSQFDEQELKSGRLKLKINQDGINIEGDGIYQESENPAIREENYRYRRDVDTVRTRIIDTSVEVSTNDNSESEGYQQYSSSTSGSAELSTPLSVFSRLFQ